MTPRASLIDYLQDLASATTIDAAWGLHCDAMAGFGFDRLIYGFTRLGFDASAAQIDDSLFLSNHDPAYFDRYIRNRMFLQAPMIRWARENFGACSWGRIWSHDEALNEAEREVIAFNKEMGVSAGYSISFATPTQRHFGLIALAGRPGLTQGELDCIWADHGVEIEIMNHMAHLKFQSLPPQSRPDRLTGRQREVLQWVAMGKTNQDIALLLGVSLATVEKHLRLAREKLGVDTTAQAVLKAAFHDQIFPA